MAITFRFLALLVLSQFATAGSAAETTTQSPPRTITVVSDNNYPPFVYINQNGQPEGYLVDLWKLWKEETGIDAQLTPLPWAEAQRRAKSGESDVIETIFRTPDREQFYDFTEAYAKLPVSIYADKSISGIPDVASLKGFLVGVLDGDACVEHLERDGVSTLKRFAHYAEVVTAAKAQTVKIFCMDEYPANFYLYQQNAHKDFVKLFDYYQGEFHRAVPKGHRETLALVEKGMALISPEEKAKLEKKWLGSRTDWLPYARIAAIALVGLLVTALGFLLWVRLLRAAVQSKTNELAQEKAKLLESEARFRKLFEDTRQPIALLEGEQFTFANRATLEMLHMAKAEELIGLTVADVSPEFQPDGRHSAENAVEVLERARNGREAAFEWECLRANGERFPAELLLTPIKHRDIVLVHAVWNDISERKAVEAELNQYRTQLEELVGMRTAELDNVNRRLGDTLFALESVGTGIYFGDGATGRLLTVNRYAAEMLGYTQHDLEALTLRDIDAGTSPDAYLDYENSLRQKGQARLETSHRRKDGTTFPVEITTYLQKGATPSLDRWFAFVTDISKRKADEQALHEAKRVAEEASRAKSSFLANMSHELRTPLNGIMGMTTLALRGVDDPTARAQLANVDQASRHLLAVINDVLDISKIEAESLELEQADFSLSQLLPRIANMTGPKIADKGLKLLIDLPEELGMTRLRGDAVRLSQIYLNLVGNAVKFTSRGSITVSIRLIENDPGQVVLRSEIKDTGIGIAPGDQHRLFTSFEQADNSMTRKYGGTGLGLAISKRLIQLMGGDIGVHSEAGRGSTFWFTVRLEKSHDADPGAAKPAPTIAEEQLKLKYPGTRILLVEDEPINQEVTCFFLGGCGLVVDTAEDGVVAVDMASRFNYDLILMDMQMPNMNGIDATRAIRALHGYKHTPILAMTANAFEEDRRLCLEAGMNDHISKPVVPELMFETLLRWLRKQEETIEAGSS